MGVLRKFTKRTLGHRKLTRLFSCPVKPSTEMKSFDNLDKSSAKSDPEVKSFDSIPGPKSFPVIGTLYKYIPFIGEYKFDKMHENGLKKLQQFGPVVREDIIPGIPLVFIYTPADIAMLHMSEGKNPDRRSHLALKKYRADRPHIYNKNGGVLLSDGEDWSRLRLAFQRNLTSPNDVRSRLSVTDTIMKEFVQYAARSSGISDFLPKLSRLNLELTNMVAFSSRLHSFSEVEQDAHSVTSQLIEAAYSVTSCILKTDNGPQLWRYWRTPTYRKLEKSVAIIEKQAIEMVDNTKAGDNSSLVSQYLTFPEIDKKDIYNMAVDFILAGIDTTTYTSCFLLYHLATNPEAQERLYHEACQLLPSPQDSMTKEILAKAKFTRAVIKETYRLNPVSVGISRILAKNAVMSGYNVPAGTVVITQNQVSCRLEEYFHRPDEFIPERQMKDSPGYQNINPCLILPFGHGKRSCLARYMAEQTLFVLLLRLIREYKITWHGSKLGVCTILVNKPDQPVLLSLTRRDTT